MRECGGAETSCGSSSHIAPIRGAILASASASSQIGTRWPGTFQNANENARTELALAGVFPSAPLPVIGIVPLWELEAVALEHGQTGKTLHHRQGRLRWNVVKRENHCIIARPRRACLELIWQHEYTSWCICRSPLPLLSRCSSYHASPPPPHISLLHSLAVMIAVSTSAT